MLATAAVHVHTYTDTVPRVVAGRSRVVTFTARTVSLNVQPKVCKALASHPTFCCCVRVCVCIFYKSPPHLSAATTNPHQHRGSYIPLSTKSHLWSPIPVFLRQRHPRPARAFPPLHPDGIHTPSIAFRHLPPEEGCRKPVLGVCPDGTLRASLSGTFLQMKDVVNQSLESAQMVHTEHHFPAPSPRGRMP